MDLFKESASDTVMSTLYTFRNMLYANTRETINQDILLSDEVQIGPETVMSTLYTAKKYAVPTLERHCVDFLKKNLSPDNACMLLTQV